MKRKKLLLQKPERGAKSRIARVTQMGKPRLQCESVWLIRQSTLMLALGLCARPGKWAAFCQGLSLPATTHEVAWRDLSGSTDSETAAHRFDVFSQKVLNACGNKNTGTGAADNNIGIGCWFWSSSQSGGNGFYWYISTYNGYFYEGLSRSDYGLSVRLFREGISCL